MAEGWSPPGDARTRTRTRPVGALCLLVALALLATPPPFAAAQSEVASVGPADEGNPCGYLSSGPDGAPLQRNVSAALAGEADEFVVGALGIQGSAKLFDQFNDTFSRFLTDRIGAELGKAFRMVYLDFDTAFRAVEDNCVDFAFTNPSMHLCLELEFGVTPVVTLLNFRQGFSLDRFYGTMFTRSDRDDINTIEDMKGKILEAVSVTGLGACQLQWFELQNNGYDLFHDSSQVRFSYNQQTIVKDVIAGNADVGMVRTDLSEGMAKSGIINLTDIKVIHVQNKADDSFPFPYSTQLAAPEWPLANMKHIPTSLISKIANALYTIAPEEPAALSGLYAGWVPPVSYMSLFTMLGNLGFLQNNKCTGNSDTYTAVQCPAGYEKPSQEDFAASCDAAAVEDPKYLCPDGFICVCQPCVEVPVPAGEETGPVGGAENAGPASNQVLIIVISLVVAVVAVVAILAAIFVFRKKQQKEQPVFGQRMSDEDTWDDLTMTTNSVDKHLPNMINKVVQSKGLMKGGLPTTRNSQDPELKSDGIVVLELLATAGNSRVYKVSWNGTIVAQKRIQLPSRPEFLKKKQASLAMEAAISASMSHPNVVQTFTCEVIPVKRILVVLQWEMRIIQEFCNMGSVSAALQNGDIPGQTGSRTKPDYKVALQIARDVAAGMLHIHNQQIVHADLKGGNVLLKSNGPGDLICKVADFGLSVKMDEDQTHVSGVHAGTLTHMSPELLLHGVSAKPADVYAYGIMMYELFSGLKPWQGMKPAQIIQAVVQGQKRPVFPPDFPLPMLQLATKCWAQDPEQRPDFNAVLKTVTDLLTALNSSSTPTSADGQPTGEEDADTAEMLQMKQLQQGSQSLAQTPSTSQRGLRTVLASSSAHNLSRAANGVSGTTENVQDVEDDNEEEEEQTTTMDEDTIMFVMNTTSSTGMQTLHEDEDQESKESK